MLGLAALQRQQVQTQGHIQYPVSVIHVLPGKASPGHQLSHPGRSKGLCCILYPIRHPQALRNSGWRVVLVSFS